MTFRFASSYFFLLIIVIPAAIYFRNRNQMQPSLRVSESGSLKVLKKSVYLKIALLIPVLKYTALALMIIAMARPQWGTKQTNILSEGVNIVLAVDTSESMSAIDFRRDGKVINRLEAVKRVVSDFISKRNGDRIGMVVFGSLAYTQVPLTRDYNAISTMIEKIKIGGAGPNTAIGDAIGISLKRLEDIKSKSNIIIVLTDGCSNSGELSPETATEIAEKRKVKIYTVGIGGKGEAPFLVNHPLLGEQYVYQKVDMDENMLKYISEKTGGLYFSAKDMKTLEKIYETIDRLEKTEVKMKVFEQYRELYPYFLLPAFLLLCLWILLSNTKFLRVP